jgi:hypothetical protein
VLERDLMLDADALAFVTHSRRLRRPGILGRLTGTGDPDVSHLTVVVIGPRDVVVATHGEQRGAAVLSARLEDVDVASLADELAGTGIDVADEGMTITGFATSVDGAGARGSYFVGLGPPDGDAAREALRAAVRAAKSA